MRDDRECQYCGDTDDLHVHHIDPHEEVDNPESANHHLNLVALCASCHKTLEYYNPRKQETKLWDKGWRPKKQMKQADVDNLPSDLTTTTLEISLSTWQDLNQRKTPGDSFDDVIQRLFNDEDSN